MVDGWHWLWQLIAPPWHNRIPANWLDNARLMRVKAPAKTYFHDHDTRSVRWLLSAQGLCDEGRCGGGAG
jgi:hypothetical protein